MNGCPAAWTALAGRGVSHLCDLDSFLPLRQGNSDWNNVTTLGCIFIFKRLESLRGEIVVC